MKLRGKFAVTMALLAILATSPVQAGSRTRNRRRPASARSLPSSHSGSSARRPPSKTRAGASHRRSAAHGRRRSTVRSRLAQMQMAPERVAEIQRALLSAGELQGTPTGRWDTETRDGMARYQSANGFAVTGLPDAKSLMKLGLGPHALPPDLEPTRASASSLPPAVDPPAPQPGGPAPRDPAPVTQPPEEP